MEVGAPVWITDARHAWLPGIIVDVAVPGKASVQLLHDYHQPRDKDVTHSIVDVDCSDVLAANAADFCEAPDVFFSDGDSITLSDNSKPLVTDSPAAAIDDLVRLPHLHEASVLHALVARYKRGIIYTRTGHRILLALNPFEPQPELYGPAVIAKYVGAGHLRALGGVEGPPLLLYSRASCGLRPFRAGGTRMGRLVP